MRQTINIAIMSQDDGFVIPENVMLLAGVSGVNIKLVIVLNSKGSLKNRKKYFISGFGVVQSFKMGLKMISLKAVDMLDQLSFQNFVRIPRSLRAAAMRCGAKYIVSKNPNSDCILSELKAAGIDLVVSFSAPCVFKDELLCIPRLGCINLHCSLLPKYAGILPSFWVLYFGELETGATVHYMDDKIDNGAILAQRTVSIDIGSSMFMVIQKTKRLGGALMVEVVKGLSSGSVFSRSNPVATGSYFSWPSIEELKCFRRSSGRLL